MSNRLTVGSLCLAAVSALSFWTAASADDGLVSLQIGDQPLIVPAAHIWNRDLRTGGSVSSVNLFFLLPDMEPVTEETESMLTEPGFGPVVLANITTLAFGLTVDQRFARGAERNHWSTSDLDLSVDGLQSVRGPLSDADVQDWYALVEDEAITGLIACTDVEIAPYPSCTAHLDLWGRLAMIVNFDAVRLNEISEIADMLISRLDEFRAAAEGIDL